jgi:general secretion pathway protein F
MTSMPNFGYRALTQEGQVVVGSISAPSAEEVAHRVEYLGLVLIDRVTELGAEGGGHLKFGPLRKARPEDVTTFTTDLALLLRAGARLHDALELLANDMDIGPLRSTVAKIRAAVFAGETFADALSQHPTLFPSLYTALVRVGETAGTLDHILEVLANERSRAEALRRKLSDALRYPVFVLFAASCVMIFFLAFVLPQFGNVLRDFGAKLDPVIMSFMAISDQVTENKDLLSIIALVAIVGTWVTLKYTMARTKVVSMLFRLPVVRSVMTTHRTVLFCRNLGVLLGSAVSVTTTLRILGDMMVAMGGSQSVWSGIVERVRQGAKVTDALSDAATLPAMAVRMLRLGEETGQLSVLAGRVAEFYEAKLQRMLDRIVGITGPVAIVTISIIVGGLIVSIMTSLLSVTQIVG